MKDFFILLFGSIILTAILIFVSIFVGSALSSGKSEPAAVEVEETSEVAKDTDTMEVPTVAPSTGGISIPGFSSVTFSADELEQNITLYNPENNKCYFIISLLLPDGTEIYKSGMLKPGECIEKITLTKELEPGLYNNAIVRYDCYELETLQQLNGANAKFNLEVR